MAVLVEVQSAKLPVHSGMAGGALADAALALDVVLSRLYWKNGKIPIPAFYDKVRKPTAKVANRKALQLCAQIADTLMNSNCAAWMILRQS